MYIYTTTGFGPRRIRKLFLLCTITWCMCKLAKIQHFLYIYIQLLYLLQFAYTPRNGIHQPFFIFLGPKPVVVYICTWCRHKRGTDMVPERNWEYAHARNSLMNKLELWEPGKNGPPQMERATLQTCHV